MTDDLTIDKSKNTSTCLYFVRSMDGKLKKYPAEYRVNIERAKGIFYFVKYADVAIRRAFSKKMHALANVDNAASAPCLKSFSNQPEGK